MKRLNCSLPIQYFDLRILDCYRKKQSGDCNSPAFRRAAAEKAELVFLTRHPNLPMPFTTSRLMSTNRLSRQLSTALRQKELEYRFNEKKNSISKNKVRCEETDALLLKRHFFL